MITISDLLLQYGDRVLFNRINISISPGEKIGLVGKNGAGKSTIFKILAGEITPDEGKISFPNNTTIGFLKQDMKIRTEFKVMDEALSAFAEVQKLSERIDQIQHQLETRDDYQSDEYSKLLDELSDKTERFHHSGGDTMEADAEKVLSGLGFKTSDMQRPVAEFSGGWQMRIELAKILLKKPDYLLLDEPTNHLDIESILWLEEFLRNYEGTVILISHDKLFLDNITKRTLEIELGNIYEYKSNYSKFKILRAERREKLLATFKNQQKEIAHKEMLIEKFRAKANKARMAQSLIKQLDKMERVEIDREDNQTLKLRFLPAPRSGETVVEIKNLDKSYGNIHVLQNSNVNISRSERIAFVGQNGQGKTTLIKIIAGVENATSGEVNLGHNVIVGYYDQNQAETLDPRSTILETLENQSPEEMRTKLRSLLGNFMFSGDDVEKKISVLSGGERARVALACLMLRPVNLLILDEPTNHLDIPSKEIIKEALMNYNGSLIVVSHDRDFLTGLTTKTLEFRNKKLYTYLGDVKYFMEKRRIDHMREAELKDKNLSNSQIDNKSVTQDKLNEKEQKRLKKQLRNLENKIERIENEISKLEHDMAEPGFYNRTDSNTTIEKHQDLKTKLKEVTEEWEMTYLLFD